MNKPAPFTVKQREYLMRCMPSWFNVAEGGKRGGKNVLQTMAFCIALDGHENRLHLVSGVSTATARLNILDCDGFGLMNYFEGRCRTGQYQNRDCLYIGSATGEKIVLISGGGKNGDEKLIKGNTYGMAYVTEANECAQVFLQEIFDRTLSSADRKIFHDLNPKAEGHWYYTDILNFHKRQQEADPNYGYNYGHFTIADNMSISDEKLKREINTYDKGSIWYQRDILGKRKQAEGLIYDMLDRAVHVVPAIPKNDKGEPQPRRYTQYYVSCDYGTQNATVFGLWGLCGGVWYCVKEYYYSGRSERRQKTDEEYVNDYLNFIKGLHVTSIIVDPSAASFIAALKQRGISVTKAKNDVLDGIRLTASLLLTGKIKICDNCVKTIEEFDLYTWDEKAVGEDRPIKENDHAMDETRYFCYTILNNEGQWLFA